MSAGDFADLYGKAIRAAQRDSTLADDVTRAKEAVNEAMSFTCAGEPWDFMMKEGQITLTGGSDVYTYLSVVSALSLSPHSIEEIHAIVCDSENEGLLYGVSWHEIEQYSASTQGGDATDVPTHWASWQERLRFYPTPDDDYTMGVFLQMRHGNLTNDADESLIPLNFRDPVIVPYAAAVLLRQEGGLDAHSEADRWMAHYDRAVSKMRMTHATARHNTLRVAAPSLTRWLEDY